MAVERIGGPPRDKGAPHSRDAPSPHSSGQAKLWDLAASKSCSSVLHVERYVGEFTASLFDPNVPVLNPQHLLVAAHEGGARLRCLKPSLAG